MKLLLGVTAQIEGGAGVALLGFPSATVAFLLGAPLDTPVAVTIGRIAGAALLALGVACWLARHAGPSRAARGLVAAILLYNVTAVALFVFARVGSGLVGVGLWPGVALHAAMAVWCIVCLCRNRGCENGGVQT
jgi:hypothetical protein